jgi:hypothetical protein
MFLLPPPPSHPLRPTSLKLFVNLPHCPGFDEVADMRPVMDVDLSAPPKGVTRTVDGRRDVEEWGLKVQKMASVHSITLVLVSLISVTLLPCLMEWALIAVSTDGGADKVQSESIGGQRSKLFYVGFKGEIKSARMDMSKLGQVPAAGTADSAVDGVAEKKGSGYTTIH